MRELKKLTVFCCFFGFFFNSLVAQATNDQEVGQINHQEEFELFPYALVYEDTARLFSISTIQNKTFSPLAEFQPTLDVNVYWVKLRIKSNLEHPSNWRLSLFDDWCEEVQVYSKTKESPENWLIQQAGYLCPIKDLDQNKAMTNKTRKTPNAVSVSLEPEEEKIIFIRYLRQNRESLQIQPRLIPMIVAANQIIDYDRGSFLVILFMSMLCVLALYHLVLFLINRDQAYLYYALYGFCAAFAATVMDQYGWLNYHLFYSEHPEIQTWVFNTSGVAVVAAYILFTRSFLETKKRFPKLDIAIKVLLAWAIIMGVVANVNFALTDRQYIPGIPFSAFVILVGLVFGTLVVSIWRDKKMTDTFYLIGLGMLLAVIIPRHLFILFGWIDPNSYLNWVRPLNALHVGLLIELLVFALGLGYRTRQVKREKQRFEELDQMKSRFFANISHEFRTPLTLIMGPLKEMKERTGISKDRNLLQMAHRNAGRLLQLINQLLDLSKLEAGKMELKAEEQNFALLLKGIVMSFESLAERKNIRLHFVTQKENIPLFVDKDKIEKIFYNLLSNAFKFTKENGEVAVMIADQKNQIEILVRDNGVGVSKERLPHIFNRFFQGESTATLGQEGTGIGLALVKEFVELHAGKIRVESKGETGTSFTIVFPKGKAHLTQNEIIKETTVADGNDLDFIPVDYIDPDTDSLRIDASDISQNTNLENKMPVVLIIEDNTDVRTYIKQHLNGSFQILEAINGQEGIDKALEHLPDLIISDVMMPKKNGYEVCAILKTDQRTSHIPLILLTAKAASEEKLKGLETGADDYLVKPFDTRELEVRVRNLIDLRRQLRQRFSEADVIVPQDAGTNAVDKAFLEKACLTIESHLSDEQFGVEILAQEIGLSRSHLNRKLKALSDLSANKFIQSYRLQKAMEMLRQKRGNVSEIAIETGFSSTAYFVKCFGDKYGKTPGAVLQE